MAYIYQVTSKEEDSEEVVHFDTATGSSDSFSDAHNCFSNVCFKLLCVEGTHIIKLIENGKVKKELDRDGWLSMRSGGKKKGKSKSKGSPDKKATTTKKAKVSPEPKKKTTEPIAIEEPEETQTDLEKFAYEEKGNKKAKIEQNEKVEIEEEVILELQEQSEKEKDNEEQEKVKMKNKDEEVEEIMTEEEEAVVNEEEDTQKYSFKEDSLVSVTQQYSFKEDSLPQTSEIEITEIEETEEDKEVLSVDVVSPFFASASSPSIENKKKKRIIDDDDDDDENESKTSITKEVEVASAPILTHITASIDSDIKYRSLSLPVRLRFKSGAGLELIIMRGDITTWKHSSVDESCTVVNAANERMLGGGGVDGAIHRAAGKCLRDHCKKISEGVRCETGDSIITPSFDMDHVDSIIHTPGPVYDEDQADLCRMLLCSCYQSSLALAVSHGHSHIGFPALSCGVFGYPLEAAAEAALETIENFSEKKIVNKKETDKGNKLKTVTFVMFEKTTVLAWLDAAQQMGMALVDHPSMSKNILPPQKTSSSSMSDKLSDSGSSSSLSSSSLSTTSSTSNGSVGPKGKFLWQVAAQKAKENLIKADKSMAVVVDAAQTSKS